MAPSDPDRVEAAETNNINNKRIINNNNNTINNNNKKKHINNININVNNDISILTRDSFVRGSARARGGSATRARCGEERAWRTPIITIMFISIMISCLCSFSMRINSNVILTINTNNTTIIIVCMIITIMGVVHGNGTNSTDQAAGRM